MDKLKPRDLKQDDIDFLLSLKTDDITLDLGRSFFAYKKDKMPRFSPQDRFVLPKDSKFKNSTPIPTTVGRYIVNTFLFLEPDFIQYVGYQNTPLNKGGLGKVNAKLADLIVKDKISTKDFIVYLDKCHFMGYGWNDFLATSVNLDFINPNKEIRKFKKKVFEENKEEFSKEYVDIGQVIAAETKIIDFAKDQMKDNPAKEIFDAGSRGSFENNFKKTSLMIGGNRDLIDPDKFTVNLHNFAEGTSKKDLILLGNDMVDSQPHCSVMCNAYLVNCWKTLTFNQLQHN